MLYDCKDAHTLFMDKLTLPHGQRVCTPSSLVRERVRKREEGRERERERERGRKGEREREYLFFKRNDGCLGIF